jgi:NTE family protein
MHFVPLPVPRLENEGHTKGIDFSASTIRMGWDAGLAHTQRALELAPWKNEFDSIEGVILHEPITSPASD